MDYKDSLTKTTCLAQCKVRSSGVGKSISKDTSRAFGRQVFGVDHNVTEERLIIGFLEPISACAVCLLIENSGLRFYKVSSLCSFSMFGLRFRGSRPERWDGQGIYTDIGYGAFFIYFVEADDVGVSIL